MRQNVAFAEYTRKGKTEVDALRTKACSDAAFATAVQGSLIL